MGGGTFFEVGVTRARQENYRKFWIGKLWRHKHWNM